MMVKKLAENAYSILKEIQDIDQILKYGNCSESQRKYLRNRRMELEKKLGKL